MVLTGSPSVGLPSGVSEVPLSANPLIGSQVVVCQFVSVDSLVQASVGLVSNVIHANPGCKKVLQLTDFAWSKFVVSHNSFKVEFHSFNPPEPPLRHTTKYCSSV